MSDTFYGLECLVRERARAVERDVQRQRLLAVARGRHRRPSLGNRFKGVVAGVMWLDRFLPGRTKGRAGMGACQQ